MIKLLLENWRKFLKESALQEKSKASKMGVELRPILDTLKDYVAKNERNVTHFIQFSDIEKLGINPQSHYDTPLGIYSYPLIESIYSNLVNKTIPFAFDRKNIILFEYRGSGKDILIVGSSNVELNSYYSRMDKEIYAREMMPKFFEIMFPKQERESTDEQLQPYFLHKIQEWEKQAKCEDFMCKFWNVTRNLADKKMTIWNNILRQCGYNGVIDIGTGLIHPSESTQAVFFSMKDLKIVKMFDNKLYDDTKKEKLINAMWLAVNTKKFKLISSFLENDRISKDLKQGMLYDVFKVGSEHVKVREYIIRNNFDEFFESFVKGPGTNNAVSITIDLIRVFTLDGNDELAKLTINKLLDRKDGEKYIPMLIIALKDISEATNNKVYYYVLNKMKKQFPELAKKYQHLS